MSQYFPKRYKFYEGNINVKVDLSNYATKNDLKKVTHDDTSSFSLKSSLASLKTEVDQLYIDKSEPVFGDFSKLSDVTKMILLKSVRDKIIEKVNNINTSGFVLKTDKSNYEQKTCCKKKNNNNNNKKINYNKKN